MTDRIETLARSGTLWGFPVLYLGWAYLFWAPNLRLEHVRLGRDQLFGLLKPSEGDIFWLGSFNTGSL